MKLLSKKENLKTSIPFMALMTALIVVLSIFGTYLPLSSLIIALFITLPSVFVSILVPRKFYIIYFISALGLSLLTSFNDISFTLSFIFPSLIIGFLQGLFIDKKYNCLVLTYISSIIYFILEILLFYFVKVILNVSMIEGMEKIFHLHTNEEGKFIVLSLILISSFLSISLSTYVMNFEIKKIGYSLTFNKYGDYFFSFVSLSLSLFTFLFYFYSQNLEWFLFITSAISLIFLIINNMLIKEYKLLFTLLIIFPLYLIFIIFSLENYVFVYFSLVMIVYSLVVLIYSLIMHIKNKRINSKGA